MGLIHDEDVPVARENGLLMAIALCGVDARNDLVVSVEARELVVVITDEFQSELRGEFALPLFRQLCGGQDQHRAVGLAVVHLV